MWDRIEGSWKQMTGKAKEQWGKLTDDDLTEIAGKRDQLAYHHQHDGRFPHHLRGAEARQPAPAQVGHVTERQASDTVERLLKHVGGSLRMLPREGGGLTARIELPKAKFRNYQLDNDNP